MAIDKTILSSIKGAGVSTTEHSRVVGLYVCGKQFTDSESQIMVQLKHLSELQIDYTSIGIEGLKALRELPKLKSLWFYDDRHGNSGVHYISRLTQLETLGLRVKDLTDEGLDSIAKLRNLKSLEISGSSLSSEAVNALQKALPNCTIKLE